MEFLSLKRFAFLTASKRSNLLPLGKNIAAFIDDQRDKKVSIPLT